VSTTKFPTAARTAVTRAVGGAPTMQDVILTLQDYWAAYGATISQPLNTEVGAGTANPATALRVLGPEPWKVAYVEPSVRPDDARYGENPNRLQTHTQFQVIIKPEPGNPQEIYLASLEAIGIDLHRHDVRFVEDNWASPALGAWGLGWEVWLDGMEITQFTYFQQAGGVALQPVSVEITYGLERILMALQGVDHFTKIQYAPGVTYGELFAQAEYEMSRYYLDDADVDFNSELFAGYAAEAERMIALELPIAAYSYVLKCSHTFNVLDARGAISTTERAKAFGVMRNLTHQVSLLWMRRREELGHPLGLVPNPEPARLLHAAPAAPTSPATLLLEVGFEELPHADVRRTAEALRFAIEGGLAATSLERGAVTVSATPRRVVLTVAEVAPRESTRTTVVRGPRATAAWNADGQPTKALAGFLRRLGATAGQVTLTDVNGTEYVTVTRAEKGRGAPELLVEVIRQAITGLRASKNMRWADPHLSYSRPIRWLVAMLGNTPLPLTVSSLVAGTATRGLRLGSESATLQVGSADGFAELLTQAGVVLDRDQRRALVVLGAQVCARSVGGEIEVERESALIDEITDLVESPTPLLGSFEERYLELPSQVLTTVMKKHQRYLPVVRDNALLPYFVTMANGPCDEGLVRAGNESVIRARYEDASYFWRADLKIAPAEFRARLAKLTFEDRLGSVGQRADRIGVIARTVARVTDLDDDAAKVVDRAAELAKFDLATQMVVELPSLAGVMAREYALRAGEQPAVANALAEMEQPRSAEDVLPASSAGAVMSLADRLDLLVSLFTVGAQPTGSSDPYGLRRTALGILRVLRANPQLRALAVSEAVSIAQGALAEQGVEASADAMADAIAFVGQRLEQQLAEAGHPLSRIRAVMGRADRPVDVDRLLSQLDRLDGSVAFSALVAAVQRVLRIVPTGTAAAVDDANLLAPAEHQLATVHRQVVASLARVPQPYLTHYVAAAELLPSAINRFFDDVLVMDADPTLRAARLGLLASIAATAQTFVDWSAL
jgi:glycyl-tRNA synthetase